MINTEEPKQNKILIFFIIAFLLIVGDQASKFAINKYFGVTHLDNGYYFNHSVENIKILGSFLEFTYVENEGMAFGISFGAGKIFLSIFSVLAGFALGFYLFKLKNYSTWVKTGIMLIFSGAIGNLIDRLFYGLIFGYEGLFYGKVIDFVKVDIPDIHFMGLNYTHWPVFNIADSCVTIGIIILLIFHKKIPSFKEVFSKTAPKDEGMQETPA